MLNCSCGKSTRYFDRLPDDFSLIIPRYFKDNVSNVLPRLLDWHYLLTRCFALTYDPINNKSKVNKPIIFGFFLVTFPLCFLSFSYSFSCNSMPCSRCSALRGVGLNEKKYNAVICFDDIVANVLRKWWCKFSFKLPLIILLKRCFRSEFSFKMIEFTDHFKNPRVRSGNIRKMLFDVVGTDVNH